MIKLIASDMDGTLLDNSKKLTADTYDVIEKLHRKGILFAAASGRQMASLEKLFAPVKDKVIFIAENGGYVKFRDEEIFSDVMDKELVKDMVLKIKDRPNLRFLLEGKECAYTDHITMYKAMTGSRFNYNVKLVEDSADVHLIEDEFVKAALSDVSTSNRTDFEEMHYFFNDRCTAVLSGPNCLDFQNFGVNKGSAIRIIKEKFGFSADEIISFGDNFNDMEMLFESGTAFVMENSSDEMKEKSKALIIGSNDDGAVIETIKKLVLEV